MTVGNIFSYICLTLSVLFLTFRAEAEFRDIDGKETDIGIYAQNNNKKKNKTSINTIKDSDGDGVPDDEDLCPDIPGPASAKGCPDSDGDGIPDFEDDCPGVPGLPQFNGCPDSDGDGIPDNKDVCPYEPGPAWNNGCPVSESEYTTNNTSSQNSKNNNETDLFLDGEEFFDTGNNYYSNTHANVALSRSDYERFRNESAGRSGSVRIEMAAGTEPETGTKPKAAAIKAETRSEPEHNLPISVKALNKIMPQIIVPDKSVNVSPFNKLRLEKLLSEIEFDRGRIILSSSSYPHLDDLAAVMYEFPEWKIILHCYVNEASNNFRDMQLSANRGRAIKSYLVNNKRIHPSRIDYKGYGNRTDDTRTDIEITMLK